MIEISKIIKGGVFMKKGKMIYMEAPFKTKILEFDVPKDGS